MQKYEVLYILSTELDDDAKNAIIEKLKSVVEEGEKGVVTKIDKWGNRKLAYPINKKNEGYYVLMYFDALAEVPKELERIMRINADIVRYIVIKEEV